MALAYFLAMAVYATVEIVLNVRDGEPVIVALNLVLLVACVIGGIFAIQTRRRLREYRRTARDRERPDPRTSASTGPRSPSTLSTGTGRARPGTRPGVTDLSTIPERTDDTPFLAAKRGRLIWIPGDHFLFGGAGVGQATQYGVRSRARCVNGDARHEPDDDLTHTPPVLKCTCGFYALATTTRETPTIDRVSLDVELGGRVIVGQQGYRAEWQRVLSVWLPQVCFICEEPATAVGITDNDGGPHQVLSWCATHATDKYTFPLDTVAADLGIPVAWQGATS